VLYLLEGGATLDRLRPHFLHQPQRFDLLEGDAAGLAAGVLDEQVEGLIVEQAHPPAELIRPILTGETDLDGGADLSSQGEFTDGSRFSLGG